jgi:hypothetical protein
MKQQQQRQQQQQQQQQQRHSPLQAPLFLLLALPLIVVVALLPPTASAFVVSSISRSSCLRSNRPASALAIGRQRGVGVVVGMAKGNKGSKSSKRGAGNKSSSWSNQPPAPEPKQQQQQQQQQQQEMAASASSSAGGDEAEGGGFSILGSAEPPAAAASRNAGAGRKGFGAARPLQQQGAPTAKEVDEAYEQALSKIKGEPSKPKPAFGAGGLGGGGAGMDGKVPVRSVTIFDIVPESLQNGFETTLIALLAVNLLVIIGLGIGFSFQAIPTSNWDLPESVLNAAATVRVLVEKVEFLFTPSLLSFFLVSTLLGSFKIAQLGKGATTYVEKGSMNYKEK